MARSYDAAASSSDEDHRRPDIVCVWGGVRYIIDITIAWSTDTGGVEWRDVGFDADKRAASKDASYAKSLERERRGGVGWFESVRLHEADVFVPLAYEANGTWGTRARAFFEDVLRIAGSEGSRSADLYHWSAMTFGGHWRRRVAVVLGRGRVTCLRRSADRGFGGNDAPSAEVAPDSL